MAMTIDGMVSGMDTTNMVSQLMQLETLPQTALKNKVTVQNKAVAAYQGLNTRVSGLLNAARAIVSADVWGAMKATASSDAVAASAAPGSAAGSLSFTVDKLAAAHAVTFTGKTVNSLTDATGASVLTGSTLDVLRTDGTTVTVTPTDASLSAVVKKINETANAAYKASTVQVAPGQYTLQLTATTTGGAGKAFHDVTKPAVDGDPHSTYQPVGLNLLAGAVTVVGADATLTVGDVPATQYQVTSTTNTFTDLLPGVTVTAAKKSTAAVTVSVAADRDSVAAKAQALIDNANTVLQEIASLSRVKSGEVPAGPLAGDSTLRKMAQDVLGAVTGGAGGLGSLSQVGVSVTRDGKLALDKTKFLDAFAADPARTQSFFDGYADKNHVDATAGKFDAGWDTANGLGRKLEVIAANLTEGVALPTDPPGTAKEGLLTTLIKRRNESIRGLNDQVSAWDRRLELRKSALERQFSGLEVALGKMQSQSTWLAGQLAGLPSYS
jgi:flagellar hook-associated protein 2